MEGGEHLQRPWMVRSLGKALALLGAGMLVLTGLVAMGYVEAGQSRERILLRVVAGAASYTAAGLLAWWRRPSNSLGPLMVLGGVAWLFSGLTVVKGPVLASVGVISQLAPFAVLVHLLVAFPSGRLRSRIARWDVLAAYVVCLVLHAPTYLWAPPSRPDVTALHLADRPGLVTAGMVAQTVGGSLMMLVTAAILAARFRRSSPRQRRTLGPVYAYGILAVLAIPVLPALRGLSREIFPLAALVLLIGAPIVFAGAILLGGFARAGQVHELQAWLDRTVDTGRALTAALAGSLGDPSVQLGYWVPERGSYLGPDGTPMARPQPGSGRGTATIRVGDRTVGVIEYDSTLIGDPEPVWAAARVVGYAVDRQRLTAALAAHQQQLRLSRQRIVEAGDRERRRIAQNLHDGLQAELVLLAIEAQDLADTYESDEATQLRERIDRAAASTRELVYQVMPAPLLERGLGAALEDLVDRVPVPTRLHLALTTELSAAVQSTAYFIIAEAISNAVKHSGAGRITVRVTQRDARLTIRVDDDGTGGAHPHGGFGLTGIADRVEVLTGTLTIDSPAGGGTHLRVELPC